MSDMSNRISRATSERITESEAFIKNIPGDSMESLSGKHIPVKGDNEHTTESVSDKHISENNQPTCTTKTARCKHIPDKRNSERTMETVDSKYQIGRAHV